MIALYNNITFHIIKKLADFSIYFSVRDITKYIFPFQAYVEVNKLLEVNRELRPSLVICGVRKID